MRNFILFGIVISLQHVNAQEMPSIDSGWKFQTGDNPAWSKPKLDDADWNDIRVGAAWEEQGHPDYDGYAWYRLRVTLPSSLREHREFQVHRALKIKLGRIDDVDRTWFNGSEIGSTGEFPDAYSPSWNTERSYVIPAKLIRWDKPNVIAIRVYDGNGEGGMVEGPYQLEVAGWSEFIDVEFDLGRGDGIFFDNGDLPFAASIQNNSATKTSVTQHWTVENDEGKPLLTTSPVATKIQANGEVRADCPFTPQTPGFYKVTCVVESKQHGDRKSKSTIYGFRPEEVQAALTRQPDLDTFWERTLMALAAVPPEFKLVRQAKYDSDTHECYEVEMRSLGGVLVRGWYQVPTADGPHPALLRVPGYSENMQPIPINDPLAVFSFNVRGHGNSQDDVSGQPANFWIRELDDKEGYYYQGSYADCLRAVDFLASREEIDKSRIAVTGGSQGGGFSLVTAALDQRISLCAPDIPFLCDWQKYFKTTHWPEMDNWIAAEPHRSWESTLRTMSYFDALNLVDRIQCPVFLGLGLQDGTCPPATIFSVYNRINAPKEYRVCPHAGHWVDAEHNQLRREWILKHFFERQ